MSLPEASGFWHDVNVRFAVAHLGDEVGRSKGGDRSGESESCSRNEGTPVVGLRCGRPPGSAQWRPTTTARWRPSRHRERASGSQSTPSGGALLAGVLGQCTRVRFPASLVKTVAEVDDAAAESVLVDELEIGVGVGWQCGVAPTEDDWPDEQGELVDQPGDESLCCEVRATD
jgi:hypothetical protein